MKFTETLLVVPLPFVLFAAFGSRRVIPLAVMQVSIGTALGPSLFGRAFPELSGAIFRPDSLAPLAGLAIDRGAVVQLRHRPPSRPPRLRGRAPALGLVTGSSLLVTFVAGLGCGFWIAGKDAVAGANPLAFAVAIGICTSVTAMPVLGPILHAHGSADVH